MLLYCCLLHKRFGLQTRNCANSSLHTPVTTERRTTATVVFPSKLANLHYYVPFTQFTAVTSLKIYLLQAKVCAPRLK